MEVDQAREQFQWCQTQIIFGKPPQLIKLLALLGHRNQLTTLKSGEDAVQKNEKVLTVIYSEESLAKRRERNKTMGAIKQTESIYMLMSPSGCRVMKKQRYFGHTLQKNNV